MSEPTHREIINAVKGVREILDQHTEFGKEHRANTGKKLDNIVATQKEHGIRLRAVEEVANIGKGAWWAMLKIGGLLMLLIGAIAWVWEKFKSIPH